MNNLNKIKEIIEERMKKLEAEFLTDSNLEEIAQAAVDFITKRTRLGNGVASYGAPQNKLAELKTSYKNQRKGYLKKKLDSTTSPSKSNLTLTGEMLRDLSYEINNGKITISAKDAKNKKKIDWAQEGSNNRAPRPFLSLSKTDLSKLKTLMKAMMVKVMKGE